MQGQFIYIDKDGNKFYYLDKEMTKLHRSDGPAREWADGSLKEWYINGKLHREDGPAREWANGSKEWWLNDKLHREDGPAVEYANGLKVWYIDGKNVTKEEHAKLTKSIKLTLDDIAAKFGIDASKLKIVKEH